MFLVYLCEYRNDNGKFCVYSTGQHRVLSPESTFWGSFGHGKKTSCVKRETAKNNKSTIIEHHHTGRTAAAPMVWVFTVWACSGKNYSRTVQSHDHLYRVNHELCEFRYGMISGVSRTVLLSLARELHIARISTAIAMICSTVTGWCSFRQSR